MKVNVVSRKAVKPCKPTPSHLSTYKISLTDEFNPSMHIVRILYYTADSVKGKKICLEESLAKVLPLFYPLAGRYNKEKRQVDCNDEGAEYYVAEVDCELHQLTGANVKPVQLNDLLPQEVGAADGPTDPMLAVQINRFQCGGLAIGVCTSHRIFDSCSQAIFLKAWANAATGGYIFDKNAISKLRESLSTEWTGERPPSRVLLVSSILTQTLLRSDRAKHGKPRASVIRQAINFRERIVPPASKYACGTWVSMSYLELTPTESSALESDFPGIASKIHESNVQAIKDCARLLSDRDVRRRVLVACEFETAEKARGPDFKVIWITDWSKFGDYELNFGFGKPIWASSADLPGQDFICLMTTKNNDGIEAWVSLHESDMFHLEQDDYLRMLTAQ